MLIVDSKNEEIHKANHKAVVPPDDGKPITFKWHFPRGTFDKRMSAREIAPFVIQQMQSILAHGLFETQPRAAAEFQAMLFKLALTPLEALDELCSWIRPLIGEEPDDIIYLSLFDKTPQKSRKATNIKPKGVGKVRKTLTPNPYAAIVLPQPEQKTELFVGEQWRNH